jgi:GTP-binding protein
MISLRKTEFLGVAAQLDQCPAGHLPEVVLSGRSNVGKSSLINSLTEQSKLARTSQTPGKTRLIVYFNVEGRLLLVDLPGYGHATLAQSRREAMAQLADRYLTADRPIALVLLLLDIRHLPSADDHQMLAWLEHSGLAWHIVLTKADKLSRAHHQERRRAIAGALGLTDEQNLLICSTRTRDGLDDLRTLIESLLD